MKVKFSIVIPIYNEESRICGLLNSLIDYSDDIIVINKSSTDRSRVIIENEFLNSVRVVDVPYSNRGEDDFKNYFKYANNDWIFLAVASEIIPKGFWRNFLLRMNNFNLSSYDLVMIPRLYNCFGFSVNNSPWDVSFFPFFLNKNRVVYTEKMHSHFSVIDESRRFYISMSRDDMIQHITHVSLSAFLKNTLSYASYECKNINSSSYEETVSSWLVNMQEAYFRLKGSKDKGAFAHFAAWNIYWSIHILTLIERMAGDGDFSFRQAKLKISLKDILILKARILYRRRFQSNSIIRKAKDIVFARSRSR
ncbi:glycosyltransferase [Vibrio metschnikovii]|uniref:glycosyltransferase n=1 Tax=Vibrio metschnikovii TaxID=28172 RepID=UPI001C2F128B|nr:glycosyltransferase [Vibrio metschnikovii]